MSGPNENMLALVTAGIIVVFRIVILIRLLWNYPLQHGSDYFLGVQVEPGFYNGSGLTWMRRYRAVILAEHLILAIGLIAILASGQWNRLPLIALEAPLLVATMFGLTIWIRRKLGPRPPVQSSVAIALRTRQLSEYLSWPMEALVAGVIAGSWTVLLTRGGSGVEWEAPVLTTYAALGMLPMKIIVVRNSFPLPAERAEEHYRWQDAYRRYSLRTIDTMIWVCVAVLGGYAVKHGWPEVTWVRWVAVGIALAIGLYQCVFLVRGQLHLREMGRDLRPPGSWSAPFEGARWMLPGGATWSAVYFTGLVLLFVFFRR